MGMGDVVMGWNEKDYTRNSDYRVEMLRSYVKASPSGAQAHRIHILYAIASIVLYVLYLYTVHSTVHSHDMSWDL